MKNFAKKKLDAVLRHPGVLCDWIFIGIGILYGKAATTKCTTEFVYRKIHIAASMKVEMLEDLLHMLKSRGPKRSRSTSIFEHAQYTD